MQNTVKFRICGIVDSSRTMCWKTRSEFASAAIARTSHATGKANNDVFNRSRGCRPVRRPVRPPLQAPPRSQRGLCGGRAPGACSRRRWSSYGLDGHHGDSFEELLESDVDAVAIFTQRWTHGPLVERPCAPASTSTPPCPWPSPKRRSRASSKPSVRPGWCT